MKVESAWAGARVVDSLPFSQGGTSAQAAALAAAGVEGLIGYLNAMNVARLNAVLNAGLGFMPVTFAGAYRNGPQDELAALATLGIPAGATVWLDLEGLDAWNTPSAQLSSLIEAWAAPMVAAGYIAGLYVGAPQPLTGKQLYALRGISRYWLGQGRCVGRDGLDAYPDCGWCMRQDWHNQKSGMLFKDTGVFVDTNAVQADHRGRLPTWVVRD